MSKNKGWKCGPGVFVLLQLDVMGLALVLRFY